MENNEGRKRSGSQLKRVIQGDRFIWTLWSLFLLISIQPFAELHSSQFIDQSDGVVKDYLKGDALDGFLLDSFSDMAEPLALSADSEKLAWVNRYVNLHLNASSGLISQSDKQRVNTHVSMVNKKRALAVIKYAYARRLGVGDEKLRFIYVTHQKRGQVVLAYYQSANAEPIILSNEENKVKLASRSAYEPVYSFQSLNFLRPNA